MGAGAQEMTHVSPTARSRPVVTIRDYSAPSTPSDASDANALLAAHGNAAMYCDPAIASAIAHGLRQPLLLVEARATDGRLSGLLPLVLLRSRLFGRFLVSLPYVSWAGPVAEDQSVALELVDRAIELTHSLDAKFLELRVIEPLAHPKLTTGRTEKVQMRLPLTGDVGANWKLLKSEVRTQVRKAMKQELALDWGGEELLKDFYHVFARNMRDLGTPVFSLHLFRSILGARPGHAEIGVVRIEDRPIAACLAVHGPGLTEISSAASLRSFRHTAANSLLYWNAIERAIGRRQQCFDFGRSTPESPTYIFKRKWGAQPLRVVWQYYLRRGDTQAMRPDNKRFQLAIRMWQQLPVAATRVLGPMIVRGIP